jgi:hypothetical protein
MEVLSGVHGAAPCDVVMLQHWFGPALPASVDGPSATLCWGLAFLPWPYVHPLLRRWLQRGADRLGVGFDTRIPGVLSVLRDVPDAEHAARLREAAVFLINDGLDRCAPRVEMLTIDDVDASTRFSMGILPTIDAALFSLGGITTDRQMILAARAALVCFIGDLDTAAPDAEMHLVVREVVAALAAYTRTWAGGWRPDPTRRYAKR